MKHLILFHLFLVLFLTIGFFILVFIQVNQIVIYLSFIFLFVYLILVLSSIWPKDSPWAPWWRTDRKTAEAICRLAKVDKESIVYDLGSGDGEALITAARLGAKGVGVEIDPLRFWIAKFRSKKNGVSQNLKFVRGNFFNQDLSEANTIFVYLIPKTLNRLLPKFKRDLKKGTKIVSFRYEMGLKPVKIDKENKLFLYIV